MDHINLIDAAEKTLGAKAKATAQAYRALFHTPLGQEVLRDLAAKFNPAESVWQPMMERQKLGGPWEDAQQWAIYRTGQMAVVREILQGIEAGKGGE